MRLLTLFTIAAALLSGSHSHANRSYAHSVRTLVPHRFYFGPEVIWMHQDTHVDDIHVFGNRWLGGLRLGYEYLAPHAFYAGIDLVSCVGSNFDSKQNGDEVLPHKGRVGFEDLEVRFGYTLASKNFMLTPFLGAGSYNLGRIYYDGYDMTMLYAAGGIRAKYDVTPSLNIGLNAKAFFGSAAKYFRFLNSDQLKDSYVSWGGEIGVPLDWSLGVSRSWDLEVEPYFLKLSLKEKQYGIGSRVLFGYHF